MDGCCMWWAMNDVTSEINYAFFAIWDGDRELAWRFGGWVFGWFDMNVDRGEGVGGE